MKRTAPANDTERIQKLTTKVKTTVPNTGGAKKPATSKPKKQMQKNISASESKLMPRASVTVTEVTASYEIGYNIPTSVFRSLFKEIIKENSTNNFELRLTSDSVHYLKIAAENFLVSKIRLANYIRRARGKKTLSKIDIETIGLIENDPYLRRKSCPQVMITS